MSHLPRFFKVFSMVSCFSSLALAGSLKILGGNQTRTFISDERIVNVVNQVVDLNHFREVRAQIFSKYLVLQLLQIGYHRVDFMRVNLDDTGEVLNVQSDYRYSVAELGSMKPVTSNSCPDKDVQFIAFAPNNETTEQAVTADVIQAAQAKGYKVVSLLKENATRLNYLSYMTCPKLVGNFYDGDSNPESFITVDGVINASEISAMKGLFRYHVTNIWVACEAFNDPMLSSVTVDAQAQKYAAGVNDLLVGPSDYAAACAMKAAVAGSPMTQSFQDCYKQFDQASDHWGYTGQGSDYFGQ